MGGEGVTKNIYGELPKKRGLEQFAGSLAKNREGVSEGFSYLDAHYDLILVHAGT